MDSAGSQPPSLWTLPGIRRLLVLTVLGFLGFFLTLASLPARVALAGTRDDVAGLVTTAFLVCTIATQLVVPRLTRRFGLGPILVAGCLLIGGPAPLLAISANLPWVMAISAVRGCGFGILTVLGASLSATLVPAERRGEAIGIYGLAIAVPNLAAVPLGVALASAGQFHWVAFLAAAPLLAIPSAAAIGRSAPTVAAPADPHPTSGRSAVLATLPPAAVLLVVTLAGGAMLTFLPIVRPSGATATIAVLAFGMTGALSRWQVGSLADRIGMRLLLPAASLTAIAGLALLAAGLVGEAGAGWLITGAAVLGVGFGAVQNLTLVASFNRVGPSHTTTASAIWNAGFDGGTAIGAAAVGLAATLFSTSGAFLAFGALVLFSLPLAVISTRGRRH